MYCCQLRAHRPPRSATAKDRSIIPCMRCALWAFDLVPSLSGHPWPPALEMRMIFPIKPSQCLHVEHAMGQMEFLLI